MVPWKKLPEDLQKTILTMIVVFGGTSISCRVRPPVCDPPPPPPSPTPMICDPPPPPSITTEPTTTSTATPISPASPTPTPMICDPPPPPPSITVAPGQHFTVKTVQVVPDRGLAGVAIHGTVIDQYGQPLAGLPITVEHDGLQVRVISDQIGEFFYGAAEPGIYVLAVQGDETSKLNLQLKLHDVATIEWMEIWEGSQVPLPLAEIRTVEIIWQDGLTFAAETLWPDARFCWSASGGTLVEADEGVVWQPPLEPGRYLIQVVADWGRTGLAVDAAVLAVEDDGSVTLI